MKLYRSERECRNFIIGWGLDEPDFVDVPYLQKVAEHADDNIISHNG